MLRRLLAVMVLVVAAAIPARAQDVPLRAPVTHVESGELAPIGQGFDAKAATNAYLASVSPRDKARSDAYFEGGYWLLLVDVVYALVLAGLLLWFKV